MKSGSKYWLSVILVCFSIEGFSQGFVENALLFSRTKPGGSARIQALGGAQVSLGGDYSSALSNPAGLGMYNRSELTFTPGFNLYQIDSKHIGETNSNSSGLLNIPGLSYVQHMPMDKNGFLGGSFSASLSRINDFNNTFQYKGTDNASSVIDYFEEWAQGSSINQLQSPYQDTPLLNFDFPEGLAYQTYLINCYNEDPNNTNPSVPFDYINYYSELDTIGNEIRTLDRKELVKTSGAQYQWSIAYGGNYMDKLFFGASVGITTLRFKFSRTYSESNYRFSSDSNYDPLDYLRLIENITIDGAGVNLTIGAIYKPIHFFQVGMSLVTPTYYNLSDSYTAKIQTQWNNGRGFLEKSSYEPIVSDYTLKTPLKFSIGQTLFFGKYGFITSDVEFVNYGKAQYDSQVKEVSFSPENKDIQHYFTNTINYRAGIELRYLIYRLRGGYSLQNSPYRSSVDIDHSITTISAGAGIKLNKISVDLAWLQNKGSSTYSPYVFQNGIGPVANLKNKSSNIMITVGYVF